MKRIICFILVLATVFVCGCGGARSDESNDTELPSIDIDELLTAPSISMTTVPSISVPDISIEPTESETQEVTPTEPTESDVEISNYYSSNVSAGDRVSFQLYKIEPEYTVKNSFELYGFSDRDNKYICKCYVNAACTEYLYMYITGADYCDYISMEETVYSLSYMLPLTIVADAVYSDTLVDNFSETAGSIISYRFVSVSGKATYDKSKAVAYTDDLAQWQECCVNSVYSIEIESCTYHSDGDLFGAYVIDYLICVCKKADGSSFQMAIHLEDYNEYLNGGDDVVFNSGTFAYGSRLSGNTDTLYFNTPLKLYGYAQESSMILSDSEYPSIFMFHCTDSN